MRPLFGSVGLCAVVSLVAISSVSAQVTSKASRSAVAAEDVEAIAKALAVSTPKPAHLGSAGSCTPDWVPTFGPQAGLDNVVFAALQHDDGSGNALYLGGGFRSAGTLEAQGIVRWDGQQFSNVGVYPGLFVRALAVFDDGAGPKLYAAGNSFLPTGESPGVLARWDGAQWTSLGGAIDDEINSLAVFDDGAGAKLYVGGQFSTIGGLAAARVARWDGQSWSSIGATFDADVLAMTVHDDGAGARLYVGGAFTLLGGSPGDHVARFDGAGWSDIGTGDFAGAIFTLASFDDGAGPTLWAGGNFSLLAGAVRRIARWTSGAWSGVGTFGGVGRVHAFSVYDDGSGARLHAAGQFSTIDGSTVNNVMRWSGSQWQALNEGLSGLVQTLARFDSPEGTRLFAGGNFLFVPSGGSLSIAARAALWDGANWSWPTSGSVREITALGQYADANRSGLVAHGLFPAGPTGDLVDGVALRRTGAWELLGPQLFPSPNDLEMHDDGAGPRLYAGGVTIIAGGVSLGRVAKFDGVDWQAVGAPTLNNAVYALHSFDDGSGSALYAGGAFTQAGATSLVHVARWDGLQWQPVGAGLPTFAFISAFAVHDDGSGPALFAGGVSNGAGAQVANWDGVSWTPVGPDQTAATHVRALASFDDGSGPQLYASGFLLTAWEATVGIARWDGQVWSALPGELSGSPSGLVAHDDGAGEQLYVAGTFGLAGGAQDIQLARFDGVAWDVMAQGLGGFDHSLRVYDDGCGTALAFAGFQGLAPAGGDGYIARWGCQACGDAAIYCTAGTSTSGCVAQLAVGGVPSASAPQDFVVLARFVEGDRLGALVYGINGPLAAPFGSGQLCVAPPMQITWVQSAGSSSGSCDGLLVTDWNLFRANHPSALGAPFGVGDQVWAQFWIRDPLAPTTLVTSEAVEFTLAP